MRLAFECVRVRKLPSLKLDPRHESVVVFFSTARTGIPVFWLLVGIPERSRLGNRDEYRQHF